MRKIFALILLGSAATIVLPLQSAQAQSTEGADEIIVTAQKRSESINDVGISITALTGESLTNQNVTQTADLVKVVPGFNYTRGSLQNPVFTIRGIGFNEASMSAAPTVTLYLDEVPLPFALMSSGAFLDLQRVEVLKGPQGTLYGQNSTGGAINFIANKPTSDLRAGFNVLVGRYDQVETEGYVSGPITNTLRARVALRREYMGAWQISNTRPDDRLGKVDRVSGRFLLDWEPTDRLKFAFNLNGWKDRSDARATQFLGIINPSPAVPPVLRTIPQSPARPRAADWDPATDFSTDDNFYQASVRADYDLADDLTLTSITALQKLNRDNITDTDGTQYQNYTITNQGYAKSFSQELRLAGKAGDNIRWVVGGNYQRDRVREATSPFISFSSAPFDAVSARSFNRIRTYAAFGNLEWEALPGLTLQGGARYTNQKRAYEGCLYDPGDGTASAVFSGIASRLRGSPVVIPPGACLTLASNFLPAVFQDNLNEDNVSWRAGVNYKVNPDALLYANVSRGYKNGAFVTSGATFAVQLFPATQESVLAYEAGFKVGVFDRKLQLNGALFRYGYNDKQIRGRVNDPTFGLQNRLINLPRSRVQGGELQLIFTPSRNFTANIGATYVDSKILGQFVNITALGRVIDLGGESLPITPKWQLTGDVQYDIELGSNTIAFVGAGATYQSSTNGALGEEPLLDIKSYALVDVRAGFRSADDQWKVSGFVRNLTNTYYYTNAVSVGSDAAARYPGMGRTFGIVLAYSYK